MGQSSASGDFRRKESMHPQVGALISPAPTNFDDVPRVHVLGTPAGYVFRQVFEEIPRISVLRFPLHAFFSRQVRRMQAYVSHGVPKRGTLAYILRTRRSH